MMKKIYVLFLLIFGSVGVWGQVGMTVTGSHSQDFNTLITTGTATWTDNTTIANWYSQRTGTGTSIVPDAGTNTGGNLYSYGTGTNAERALGTLGSGNAAAGSFAHGVLLRNTSGTIITSITVTYTLEQWRKSGVTVAQPLTFYYRTSSSTITALNPNVNATWTQVNALTLNSPINTATASSLDGNLAANRLSASNIAIPSLSLANNDYIMLKWEDPDHPGTDHGLSIDDVTINWTVGGATPNIALSSPNPAVPAGNIAQGTNNNVIYYFDLVVTTADATLTGVTINTAGTYTTTDITNFKCWYSADNIFSSGTDVLLSTKTTALGAGTHVFPIFTNQIITNGSTGYIFITADLPCVAAVANDITVTAITTADISFLSGNKTGSAFAGGLQTVTAASPNNVTTPAASVANTSSNLTWVNPSGCYDEIMIVASQAAANTGGAPAGNGGAYTAALVYGTGTPYGNGFVVYKGSTSGQTVTGLTNGIPYFYKFFTRLGTTWSAGVEISATPAVVTVNSDYFRSKNTGDWNVTTTWESSSDNMTWMNATITPDDNANTITVRNTHIVTVALPVTADEVVVEPTATLALTAIFTVANGAGTDLSVDGTIINALLVGNHVITGTITFNAGSLYQHNRDGGAMLTATWALTSTAEIIGTILATSLSGTSQTFGNFTWNSIAQTTNLNLSGGLTTINGNFRVQNTGVGSLRMTASAVLNLVVGGNYTVEANHNLDNNLTGGTTVSIGGNFAHTAGVFESTGPVVPIAMIGVGRTFTQSGGTFNNANLNWIINAGAEITLNTNLPLAISRTLTIDGILNCGVLAVNGAGSIIVNNGGRARVGSINASGAVENNLSASGGLTLNTGSTIEFNGLAAQFAGVRTFSNLVFNNAAGATLIGAVVVNNILGLTAGLVTTSNVNLLTMAAGSSYTGGNTNSNYVRGPIKKIGNTPFVFPVGQTVSPDGGFAQIGIGNIIGGVVTDEFVAEYRRGSARTLGPVSAIGLNHVSGCDFWTLDKITGTPTVDITCYWSSNNTCSGAVYVTSLPDLVIAHFNGTSWDAFGTVGTATGTTAAGTVVWNSVSTFSPFSLGSVNFLNPLPITINYFNGTKNNGNHLLNWKVTCVSTASANIVMERSTDGLNYSSIYSIFATAVRCQQPFNYTDAQPAKGVNYYRLKMTDADGKVTYSSVVSLINATKGMEVMNIAPNPIVNGAFNLKISAAEKMQMEMVITDMQGRIMHKQAVIMFAGFNTIPVNVKNLAAGTYQLFGNTVDGRTKVLRFVVQ